MARIKLVTSLSEKLWDSYAKATMESWVKYLNLDEGSVIEVWILGPFPRNLPTATESGTPIRYKMIQTQSEAWAGFHEKFSNHPRPQVDEGQSYRFNFMPFSVKVFAMAESSWAIREQSSVYELMMWLDADVKLTAPLCSQDLVKILNGKNIAWLDRGAPWGHGETGFILASAAGDTLDIFLQQANLYGSGQLFYFSEWHDAFVFTSLMRLKEYMEYPDFSVENLNKDMTSSHKKGLYPFETSVLNNYMIHYKGATKGEASNPNG